MNATAKVTSLVVQLLVLLPELLYAVELRHDPLPLTELTVAQPATVDYVVQIGAYRSLESARAELSEARLALPDLQINKTIDSEGGALYRVVSAPYSTEEAASAAASRAQAKNIPTYIRVVDRPELSPTDTPAQVALLERASALTLSQDDNRPDQQFGTTLFGRPLRIGGEVSSRTRFRKGFRLDDNQHDHDVRIQLGPQLEFLYSPVDDVYVFVEFAVLADVRGTDGSREENVAIRRGQSWVYFEKIFDTDFSLQVGRQDIEDKREWWWDEGLDAVRLHFKRSRFSAELAIAEELIRFSSEHGLLPEDEDVTRVIGRATWQWARNQNLEFFFLKQRDHSEVFVSGQLIPEGDQDESDADLNWYGVRAMGRIKANALGRIHYWADFGRVRGNESRVRFADSVIQGISQVDAVSQDNVDGWAADVGLTLETPLPGQPSLSLGYARDSGDNNPHDGVDRAFRQTGLHDNNAKFRGVSRFRYYGELLRPELSNIRIATVSLGLQLFTNSSMEVLYHDYRQIHPSQNLRGSRLKATPLGIDGSIGREIDIVFGIEEWKRLELELVLGLFRSGNAFGQQSGATAAIAALKIDYNF